MVEARELGSGRSIHLEVERQRERERERWREREDVQCGGVRSKCKDFHLFSVVVSGPQCEDFHMSVCACFATSTLEYSFV